MHMRWRNTRNRFEQHRQPIENYIPEFKAQIERHVEQTRRHADLVEGCLKRHDASASMLKDTMGRMAGFAQAMTGLFAPDEVVKAALGSFVFEQMEISGYKTLIAAAEVCGDPETKRICEGIVREEEEMARWLDERLPSIAQEYLARAERGVKAKH